MIKKPIIFALFLALAACGAPKEVVFPDDTTMIILRHADRTDENLNELGVERAKSLVGALDGVNIDVIFSPGIQRNLDTAAPLAEARGLKVRRVPMENPANRLAKRGEGKTFVWIGNKGNLKSIWKSFGLPSVPPLEYGDLFFVTTKGVKRVRFGP